MDDRAQHHVGVVGRERSGSSADRGGDSCLAHGNEFGENVGRHISRRRREIRKCELRAVCRMQHLDRNRSEIDCGEQRFRCRRGRIVLLHVTDSYPLRKVDTTLICEVAQRVGLGDGEGERLFDEHANACLHESHDIRRVRA